jgi:predicted glycosyl hydrolase (DUF1957 family)
MLTAVATVRKASFLSSQRNKYWINHTISSSYVRRSDAAERVVAMDKKYSHRAHENLLQHVRKEYLKATSEVAELKRVLISERHAKVKTKNHIDVLNARIKKLQVSVFDCHAALILT